MAKKSYAVSQQTKYAMASALKKLMAQKPLEKITIQEITDLCHIKRQNFYYHFEDIYDLMRWMFQEEAAPLLKEREGALLWKEGLLQTFQYLQANREVCLCALRSLGREHLRRFFEADVHAVIHRTIEGVNGGQSSAHAALLTQIYVIGLAGLMESWLLGEIQETPEELIQFVDLLLEDHIRGARERIKESQSSLPLDSKNGTGIPVPPEKPSEY